MVEELQMRDGADEARSQVNRAGDSHSTVGGEGASSRASPKSCLALGNAMF